MVRSHRTDKLERGVQRLVDLWPLVSADLAAAFMLFEEQESEAGGAQLVTKDIFQVRRRRCLSVLLARF